MTPDDPRVDDIARRAMIARISTMSRNGRPNMNPLWFVWRDGRVYLGTADWTLAARNVTATGRATVLLENERGGAARPMLRMSGRARVLTRGRTGPKFYWRKVALKYFLDVDGLRHMLGNIGKLRLFVTYERQGADRGRGCVIEVSPEHIEFVTMPVADHVA
jgi:hypothetical protein